MSFFYFQLISEISLAFMACLLIFMNLFEFLWIYLKFIWNLFEQSCMKFYCSILMAVLLPRNNTLRAIKLTSSSLVDISSDCLSICFGERSFDFFVELFRNGWRRKLSIATLWVEFQGFLETRKCFLLKEISEKGVIKSFILCIKPFWKVRIIFGTFSFPLSF